MHHVRDDIRTRGGRCLRMAAALSTVLLAAACGWSPRDLVGSVTGPLPEPAPVDTAGGIHGALIGGEDLPASLPPAFAEAAIAPGLKSRLQPSERQALAEASQQAATAKRGQKISWPNAAPAPASETEAPVSGWVAAVSDPYLSNHGLVCRDLRQAAVRGEEPTVAAISLCREEAGDGAHVWVAAHWP